MEIKLLRGAAVPSAKRLLRVDHEDVQRFAIHVVKTAVEEYGAEIRSVKFLCNSRHPSSAAFTPMSYALEVNLNQIRTLRDLVFAIGHEACHSIQTANMTPKVMLEKYRRGNFIFGYYHNPLEIEADEFGMKFENDMTYENHVINPNTSSIFVQRKLAGRG